MDTATKVSVPPDVYGRLRSVISAGILIEQTIYDGFDHVKEHKALKEGSTTEYFDDLFNLC